MKSSPLRLKWVNYPAASFEITEDFEGEPGIPMEALVDAEVRFSHDQQEYFVYVHLSSKDGVSAPYTFSLTAVAGFEFDLEIAKKEYRPSTTPALVPMIAVNVSRIVYAGAREFLAVLTSRSPFGVAVLDSVLLEPRDVRIESAVSPAVILRDVFNASDEEMEQLDARIRLAQGESEERAAPPKRKGKARVILP